MPTCVICSSPCSDIPGRRPVCGACLDDMKRRKERVVDRVRHKPGDVKPPPASRALSYESQASPRRNRAGSYDTYRKGKLESDNRKSWDHREIDYLNKVRHQEQARQSFMDRWFGRVLCG